MSVQQNKNISLPSLFTSLPSGDAPALTSASASTELSHVYICLRSRFRPCSLRHSEELYRRLRQSFDIQQGSPRTQPVLQRSLPAGGLHWPVW